jgi:hypothetical protein
MRLRRHKDERSKGEKRQKLSTLDSRLSTLHFAKSWTAKSFFNHRLPGFAQIIEETQVYAWTSQAGAVLSIPFASELARDSESTALIMLRKWPCDASPWNFRGKKTGLRLVSKRGCVVKKHLQARLRVSFPQQIQHSRSESTPCFLSVFIRAIRGLKMLYSLRGSKVKEKYSLNKTTTLLKSSL